jgi:CRP-like cAMP-binding protein
MIRVPEFAPTLQSAAELRELSAFSHLRNQELLELLDDGEWVKVAPGDAVIEQGDVGDSFYAVGSGQVEVRRDGAVVDVVGPGAFFGEIALLYDVPRTATVVARTAARLFRLRRSGFDRLVAQAFKGGELRTTVPVARPPAR